MINKRPHIVVFFGGDNATHDISTQTGQWVCHYLPRATYTVTPVRVTPEGQWQVPLGNLPERGSVDRILPLLFDSVRALPPAQALERLLRRPVKALFTLLRGRGGDDGSLHSLGQALQIPVVGSSGTTCQQTAHKELCTQRVEDIVGAPVSLSFHQTTPTDDMAQQVRAHLLPPLVVKPTTQESSVGIEIVDSFDELIPALTRATLSGNVLVQEKLRGSELNVTMLTDRHGKPYILPPTIIVPRQAPFYDTWAKRRPGRVSLHTVTPDRPALWEAQAIAHDVFDRLACRSYASFDMFTDEHGVELLEVNTIPMINNATPLPQQLHAATIHPTTMLNNLLQQTLDS